MILQESTRDEIMAESLKLFGRKGYFDSTTREIAKNSGITEATLFRYFQNKEDLFVEVREKYLAEPMTELDEAEQQLTFTDCLEDHLILARAYFEITFSRIYLINMIYTQYEDMPLLETHSIYPLNRLRRHYATYLERAVECGLLPPGNYEMVSALFPSYIIRYVTDEVNCRRNYDKSQIIQSGADKFIQEKCEKYVRCILSSITVL